MSMNSGGGYLVVIVQIVCLPSFHAHDKMNWKIFAPEIG
jgi:hypothetical protein